MTIFYELENCMGSGCWIKDLPKMMPERDGWWERIKRIHAINMHCDDDLIKVSVLHQILVDQGNENLARSEKYIRIGQI